jgi:predicted aspartyl protease
LFRAGPVINIQIAAPRYWAEILTNRGEPTRIAAMIDTGASHSVLKDKLVAVLRLNPIRAVRVNTPSHSGIKAYVYPAVISLAQGMVNKLVHLVALPLQGQNIQCLIPILRQT